MDAEIVVLGVEGSYVSLAVGGQQQRVLRRGDRHRPASPSSPPWDATQGQTVLIQVRVDDEVVATHTVMFGEVAPANMAPMAEGSIDDQMVYVGATVMVDVSGAFSDADMDTLTYTAMSDMMDYATASVDGSMVTITGVAAGMATVTVTATDAAGSGMSAMQEIVVTVQEAPMELTTPMGVTVSDFQDTISVTWDPASIQNAEQIKVALFDSGVTKIVHLQTINPANDPGAYTFTGVDAGTYKVAVASFRTGDGHKLSDLMDVTVQ